MNPNSDYPRFLGDLWLEHPEYKEGEPLPEGWTKVEYSPVPEITETQKYVEIAPKKVDGVWTQQWEVQELTADELARKNAPKTAKAKLRDLGLTDDEILALSHGLVG